MKKAVAAAAPPSTSSRLEVIMRPVFLLSMVALVVLAVFTLSVIPPLQATEIIDKYGYRIVTPLEADALLKEKPDVVVLDVRKPEEFNSGHIEGAINIDYFAADFDDRIAALDPTATYLLHCKSGGRSGNTLPLMRASGITNVHHLDAGFDGWKDAGLKVVQP
ncbi:rhodanese-like domain-containing protein [Sneathiella sp. CAU 1612]|uniref:Rhodanese-like domain-containing protein n=1 Tax=Sneathiella sedimenti TaxID=2816034 RepID=A0ABS3F8E6_9PROT|nr:rhodanese-like domain-containing protein [Sneathiella sedimenti]MBO0334789.1 rhodanese-like domain-containing protein [Sneathiella sedimenti]